MIHLHIELDLVSDGEELFSDGIKAAEYAGTLSSPYRELYGAEVQKVVAAVSTALSSRTKADRWMVRPKVYRVVVEEEVR